MKACCHQNFYVRVGLSRPNAPQQDRRNDFGGYRTGVVRAYYDDVFLALGKLLVWQNRWDDPERLPPAHAGTYPDGRIQLLKPATPHSSGRQSRWEFVFIKGQESSHSSSIIDREA
jgi:hypothetical protein